MICRDELRQIGVRAPRVAEGGVAFLSSRDDLYRVNLHSRVATRILVRLGSFHAGSFAELERRASRLLWGRFIAGGATVDVRATCRKSRLYHSDAVVERVMGAVAKVAGVSESARDEDSASQLILVRLDHDECTISVDSSGALLHRRGYRQALVKAPLRETIAAAMLLAVGWREGDPLLDPFCGSGTVPIEAARIARRIAPGIDRDFAFTKWPDFDHRVFERAKAQARDEERPRAAAPVVGSDRDAGAIAVALENAERARVVNDVVLVQRPVSAVEPTGARGWVVTNPPYGVRVGERDALRNLFARFGSVLRERFAGWELAMLSPDPRLDGQLRISLREHLRFSNGGIRVRLVAGAVPGERSARTRRESAATDDPES